MKRNKWRLLILRAVLIGIVLWCFCSIDVSAEEPEESEQSEQVLEQFDLGEIEAILEDIFPTSHVELSDCVKLLMKGDVKGCVNTIKDLSAEKIFQSIQGQRKSMIHVLLLVIVAAVFTNFTGVFANKQVGEISFYMVYLLLLVICMRSFSILMEQIEGTLNQCTIFMSAVCPVYFLAVAIGTGITSATVFYEMILFFLYLFQVIIIGLVLPLIQIYMILQLLNYMSFKEELSRLSEVIKMGIRWILKGFLTLVIGMGTIQGLIAPVLDSVKRSIVGRTVEAVPVVGDGISGIGQVTMGSVVLIKNSIGVVGMLICVAICLSPFIQVGILTLLYKLIAAVTEPISDKRISGCVSSVGEGCQLLMQVIYTSGILFIIALGVVSATTS